MNYLQALRAIVGHRPLMLPAAGVLILDHDGRVLLQRRADDGLWGIPGGGMELGASTEETARREAHEETGLVIGHMTLFGVFSGREMWHEYPNGDQVAIVSTVYLTNDVTGNLHTVNNESVELRFFSVDQLNSVELSPPNKPIIARFLQHYAPQE